MASALEERYHTSEASRRLAICTSGYWIITQIAGDGYPVLGVRLTLTTGLSLLQDVRENACFPSSKACCY